MAYTSGTATNAADLLGKLDTFLRTNSTLVAAGQQWTKVATHSSTEFVLCGPGMANADQVYIGLQLVSRPTPDEYEIRITGMTGILSSATSIDGHINTLPYACRMFADSSPMQYWFVANGRRFIVVVKISTIFETMYGGLFLPYADPTQYSYPLFVGGSAGTRVGGDAITSWRSTAEGHRHFAHAYENNFGPNVESSAFMLSPQGEWLRCTATGDESTVAIGPRRFLSGFGSSQLHGANAWGYQSINERLRGGFGGEMLLTPHTLVQQTPADQTYGILHGTFHVPGFGNSAENLVNIAGVDHLVVQDVFRTGIGEFWAVALE